MKSIIAAALLLPLVASADTLDVYSQYGQTHYDGSITLLDTEDAIGQVEINGATISGADWSDTIFWGDFELHNANWIVIGDDSGNHEFGNTAQCATWHVTHDHHGEHVVLSGCVIIANTAIVP